MWNLNTGFIIATVNALILLSFGSIVFFSGLVPTAVDLFIQKEKVEIISAEISYVTPVYSYPGFIVRFYVINHGSEKPIETIRVTGELYIRSGDSYVLATNGSYLFVDPLRPGEKKSASLYMRYDNSSVTDAILKMKVHIRTPEGEFYLDRVTIHLQGPSPWKWVRD